MPRHKVANANVILSLDADFLGEGTEQIRLSREFAARREPSRQMNRLYVVEPALTITGGMADHRQRMKGGDVASFLAAVVSVLASRGIAALAPLASLSHGQRSWDPKFLVAVANDLERSRGGNLIIAGRRQPAAVHAMVAALNHALGNVGNTVEYGAPLTTDATAGAAPLGALVQDIASGGVDTLVITASNPVYGAPVDYKLGKLLERVPNSIYHALYEDETAAACKTIIPAAHPLESWGDLRATDGTVSIVQPLIAPLWGAIQEADVLAAFIGEGDVGAHALLQEVLAGAGQGARRLRGQLGAMAGGRCRSRHGRGGRDRPGRRRRRARAGGRPGDGVGEAGDGDRVRRRSEGVRRPLRQQRRGCRSCRTRSRS